jgi:glycosyltransferase involved in cell wall biosynthesis
VNIALLGTRGIPASYSGFETCVEQLGQRLVQRGHRVTVYCRSHHITYEGSYYKGMRLVKLPSIPNKYLDTIVHSFISSLHALTQHYDVALYFIAGNSPVTWIPRLVGTRTILNVDGLDWRRKKWPWLAREYIRFAEYLATFLPNRYLTDSMHVQRFYKERFKDEPLYIPYGSDIEIPSSQDALKQYGLEPGKYILFVGRLVPENCAHHLVEAFRGLDTNMKCVIVGDAPYAGDYQAGLKKLAGDDGRIIFTGYLFGRGYQELGSHAYLFVETSGVGGTHPALVEAMAMGNCVVVNNTPENLETLGEAGASYNGEVGAADLRRVLTELISALDDVEAFRHKARQRAYAVYSWEAVTDAYEQLFQQVCGKPVSLPGMES